MLRSRTAKMQRALPLLAFLLAGASAQAQDRSGWVDPPAKTSPSQPQRPKAQTLAPPAAGAERQDKPAVQASRDTKPDRTAKRRDEVDTSAEKQGSPKHRVARREHSRLAMHAMGPRSEVEPTDPPQGRGTSEQAAAGTVSEYLAAVSSDAGLAASVGRFYGERVRFHGRVMTRSALAAEKARFARRWPVRSYEPRGGFRTRCEAAEGTCTVKTAFDFRASNPTRGARSTGFGELTVTVGFAGERPVILSESSRVLQRGPAALSTVGRSREAG